MAEDIKIKIPDLGGATAVDVIEVLVKPGDEIQVDSSLVTLESEKASMEIPSTTAGLVKTIYLKPGDKVSEGDLILSLEAVEEEVEPESREQNPEKKDQQAKEQPTVEVSSSPATGSELSMEKREIPIPDLGGATQVDVIEVMVKAGDKIDKDQSLLTLEGDKATMDIPAAYAGLVDEVYLKVGDKVSEGSLILTMQAESVSKTETVQKAREEVKPEQRQKAEKPSLAAAQTSESSQSALIPTGPAVRRMARELGIDLAKVSGTGRKSRVTKTDLQDYVKKLASEAAKPSGFSLPTAPQIDFSQYGEIETKPLNKIKKLTGINVHRSWLSIPHVTQFDEADITELEAFRQNEQNAAKQAGYKLTLLAFVCKAVSKALELYPQFNSSLDARGEQLIYKKYCHLGIAVETAQGLVVPVIRDVNRLSVADIAREMTRLSEKARSKGLLPAEMSGGCFTISSLGGIGGTAFTPIVNSPEVAILGLSRSSMKPVYNGSSFIPRLMLPLSLSYDHRVIDGAEAARFTRCVAELLADIRRVLL